MVMVAIRNTENSDKISSTMHRKGVKQIGIQPIFQLEKAG